MENQENAQIQKIPTSFLDRMEVLLGESYEAYLQSFNNDRVAGIRINTDKISPERFMEIAPFEVVPIPWTTDGFYVPSEERPAKHPFYHGGLYYIQEPSAMAPVNVLGPKPGDRVLDVCAAPGGKTLQLANAVGPKGLVVSNDISASRLMAVVRNVELFGLKNVVITASDIADFANQQSHFYDCVLLDAPCSGEGMFRKDPAMVRHWQPDSPADYAKIQKQLVEQVDRVLRPGGHMVYSTCTFSPEENEAVIAHGLAINRDWALLPIGHHELGFARGIALEGDQRLEATARLYPFNLQGEGHFVAHLEKACGEATGKPPETPRGLPPDQLVDFMDQVLNPPTQDDFRLSGRFRIHGDKVLLDPEWVPNLKGVRVQRRGWYLGDLVKGRFEPAASFAMGLKKDQIRRHITFDYNDPQVVKYLKCETLSVDVENGWYVVCMGEFPLGWCKVVNGQLKNKYPASWRLQ